MPHAICGVSRPGPEMSRLRLPCVRAVAHVGEHANRLGDEWVEAAPAAAAPDDAVLRLRIEEMAHLSAMENELWRQVLSGTDTPYLRQRIRRLEALRSALCGEPAVIATDPPCHGCGAAEAA